MKSKFSLEQVLGMAVVATFVLMMLSVCIQVFSRYALPWSPSWTEELARFCFIYMVSLGAGLAIKDKSYVRVGVIFDRLGPKSRIRLEILILSCIGLLMSFMMYFSIPLIHIVTLQQSASMKLNMGLVYFSMLAMSSLTLWYVIREIFINSKTLKLKA
jgi:TRAP-type C4-dicarboxylate transport system permease small subunit